MPTYYYSQGRKVPISRDRKRLAVVMSKVHPTLLGVLRRAAQSTIPGPMLIVERASMSPREIEQLEKAGATRTVYKQGDTSMVPAPEVRVEFDKRSERAQVMSALAQSAIPSEILDDTEDRLVLRAISDSGDDAVDLANELTEKARPGMSAARMIRIVARPEPIRR